MERWWTGIVRDKNGDKKQFAIKGTSEASCRERVEGYGYEIVEMKMNSSYSPPTPAILFRCVPKEFTL